MASVPRSIVDDGVTNGRRPVPSERAPRPSVAVGRELRTRSIDAGGRESFAVSSVSRIVGSSPSAARSIRFDAAVIPRYSRPMAVEEFAVSFPPDLLAHIRAEADAHGESLSGWLADAASRKLRHVAAMAALQAFEGEHGEITEKELAEVRAQWQG